MAQTPADYVLISGRVLTVDTKDSIAQAVAVTNGKIVAVGTNDVARNTGPVTLTMIEENFQAIAELARAHQIKVILCALTPVSDYTTRKQTPQRPPADILKLNSWLRDYAAQTHAGFADYFTALVDDKGMLREGYSGDGLHPNDKGYALMAPVAEGAIRQTLR